MATVQETADKDNNEISKDISLTNSLSTTNPAPPELSNCISDNIRKRSPQSIATESSPTQEMPYSGPHTPHLSPAHEYAEAVRQWLWQRQCSIEMNNWYTQMTCSMFAMNCAAAASVASMIPPDPPAGARQPAASQVREPGAIRRGVVPGPAAAPLAGNGGAAQQRGREFLIPSLWRRLAAEFIDFFLLFTMKLGVSLVALDYVGMVDVDKYDLENLLTQDWDSNAAILMTTELIAMEIINRIFVCIFETLCLWRGHSGATPGKRIMRLRVVSCLQVIDLPDNKVQIVPGGNIGFWNALLRSTMKNFSMAFLFPICISVYFFAHKRAAYDILAGSIVVEEEAPVWPRPR